MDDQVDAEAKADRVQRLLELEAKLRRDYAASLVGAEVAVMAEEIADGAARGASLSLPRRRDSRRRRDAGRADTRAGARRRRRRTLVRRRRGGRLTQIIPAPASAPQSFAMQ